MPIHDEPPARGDFMSGEGDAPSQGPSRRIRAYRASDAAALAALYHESARSLGSRRYTPDQVAVWSPAPADPAAVDARCRDGRTVLVAVDERDAPIAYADLEPDGHIDHLYAHPRAAGTGAAGALIDRIVALAQARGMAALHVEASELARGLFERKGFAVAERRDFVLRGTRIHNWAMIRSL